LELSADEGASWAAAAGQSIDQVLRLQARLNPGELGLHDAALHLWIEMLGDSLVAMRSLSAAAGTLAIVLVFFVAREIFAIPPFDRESRDAQSAESGDNTLLAAIAALLFAVNLVTIKYSREARMYPLTLALALGQVAGFLRALRRGRLFDYVMTAALTALAIAASFSAALILVPEGLYLALVFIKSPDRVLGGVLTSGLSIVGGLVLLAPPLILYLRRHGGAPDPTVWNWIPEPSLAAPMTLFNKATGTYGFPLFAILAVTGIARGWTRWRAPISFLVLWTLVPPIFLTLVSLLIHPALVERYLLSCFVPFFMLVALGLLALRPPALRPAALAIVVAVALAHDAGWFAKTHGAEWEEASTIAATGLNAKDAIAVAPRYAVNVVRYYLRDRPFGPAVVPIDSVGSPTIVIVAESYAAAHTADLARYPHQIARSGGLLVMR
jgi:4-amino-4-deoxy-L-arabinose transferase-like glycosyltransferase